MREEDKNTEEVAGSNDSNWVSKELGMEEDDEEGELLEGALNIFIGPESNHCLALILREGIKKNRFCLGKSPKLWVGGGQES